MSWKVNSEKIAKRHNIQTFDKLTYEQAKEIGFCSNPEGWGGRFNNRSYG